MQSAAIGNQQHKSTKPAEWRALMVLRQRSNAERTDQLLQMGDLSREFTARLLGLVRAFGG
jgi:hypothetical protein